MLLVSFTYTGGLGSVRFIIGRNDIKSQLEFFYDYPPVVYKSCNFYIFSTGRKFSIAQKSNPNTLA